MSALLTATDVRTSFDTRSGTVHAVRGVDLEVAAGETVGIVGESGSGKSVLVRSLMGIQATARNAHCTGTVVFDGTELSALPLDRRRAYWGKRIAIVFQNPMTALNPVVRIGRQITEVIRLHTGADPSAAREQAVELLRQVGIPDPVRRLREYPHQLSGGMGQRVAIAIALAGRPDLLIADEPTTALDVTVQAGILALLKRLQAERGMALLLVTHNLGVLAGSCDRGAVMYAGRLVETGPTTAIIERPAMPYTEALIASTPRLENPPKSLLPAIGGRPPSARLVEPGCSFAPRCRYATDSCTAERPPLVTRDDGVDGSFACWHPDQVGIKEPRDGR